MFKSRLIERVSPLIGASVLTLAWYSLAAPFPTDPTSLFGAAATVSSIFASFLGVSKAIILTIKSTQTYKVLEQMGYTDILFGYLKNGIYASVTFAALSIVGFFIDHGYVLFGHHLFKEFCVAWIFFGGLSLFTYTRISNILFKLLKQV